MMNIVEITADNKYYIKSFDTMICNCSIKIIYSEGKLNLIAKSRKSNEKIIDLLLNILSMFFMYQGFFPTIKNIKCNGIEYDIKLVGKFSTSNRFKKISHSIIEIDENTICDNTYKNFKNLCGKYIYSFEFITSKNYENITENHKIMLLLHCVEGYIINSKYEKLINTVPQKIKNNFGKRIYFVLKELFYYDRKFRTHLLKLLKVTKFKMIKILSDTRNANSHNILKNFELNDGGYMIYYFFILYYVFRIFIVKELNLNIDEEKVKNYFYEIHDWLNRNLYKGR